MLNGPLQPASAFTAPIHAAHRYHSMLGGALLSLILLAGCAPGTTRAPVVDMSLSPAGAPVPGPAAAADGTYVVKPGDTLFKIARAHHVDLENLKRWNNLSDVNQLTVGQVLKISALPAGAPVAVSAPIAAGAAAPARPAPRPLPPKAEPAAAESPPRAATAASSRAAAASLNNWAWPAAGQVLQVFNSNTKGIDIAGTVGDPVQAAADGKVLYSGNGVRGLGNLIIISHQKGFISAYAHNRTLLVKTGAEVKRGAKIAEMGDTDTTSPRVHFEIRRQGTPVDPMQYLPPR